MAMKHANGYTLVELIIVIALTIVILVTATSLFFTTILGGGKTATAERVKQAGEHAMSQMLFLIRNARRVSTNNEGAICAAGMTSLALQGQDDAVALFATQQDSNGNKRIASGSGIFLTPSDMDLSAPLAFDCSDQGDGTPATITVSFSLRKGVPGVDKQRDIVDIPFKSKATLRSF